jgi:multidrug resistance efflux pump
MPSNEARLKKLEKKAVKVDAQITKVKLDLKGNANKAQLLKAKADLQDAEKEIKRIIKWIKAEVEWSEEVTQMLRLIDWAALAIAYPGVGGSNPPQTPPNWPPPE